MSKSACRGCKRPQRQRYRLAELAVDDNENGFGPDSTFKDFPAIHDSLCPGENLPSPLITRFPSLSNSTRNGSLESSSPTLADNDAGTVKDEEEKAGRTPPAPVGFFNSALSKTRLTVFFEYSRTRTLSKLWTLVLKS